MSVPTATRRATAVPRVVREAPGRLDAALGQVSMYVLVLAALLVVTLSAFVLAAVGVLAMEPLAMLVSLAVVGAATAAGTELGARIVGTRPYPASWAISALILFLLFWPSLDAMSLITLAVAGLLAGASKFALARRGRHLFNPAAAGAVLVALVAVVVPGTGAALWWVGSAALLPVVALGALVVLWRTRRLGYAAAYAVPAIVLTTLGYVTAGIPVAQALWWSVSASPIVFLAGFMLSEPLTTPPRGRQRLAVGALVAVVSVMPLFVSTPISITPELALVIGNGVAFVFGQRRGVVLRLASAEHRGALLDLRFVPSAPLRARGGQYLELDVPHAMPDARGRRRALSLASDPDAPEVRLITRLGEPPSAFKAALLDLQVGQEVRATGVSGDFLLPGGDDPLLLVGAGIGVTPFLAHLAPAEVGRDVVLVHAVREASELVLPAEVPGAARVIAVVPSGTPGCGPEGPVLRDGRALPDSWSWVDGDLASPGLLAAVVPDLPSRTVLVSGVPAAVASVRRQAREAGVRRVHTDAFLGY